MFLWEETAPKHAISKLINFESQREQVGDCAGKGWAPGARGGGGDGFSKEVICKWR